MAKLIWLRRSIASSTTVFHMKLKRAFTGFAALLALSLAACATQPPPPPDIPPPPKRKLDAKTQLETGRTY